MMSDLQRLRRYSYQGEGDEIAELVNDIHWAADEIERLELVVSMQGETLKEYEAEIDSDKAKIERLECSLAISRKKHELAIEVNKSLQARVEALEAVKAAAQEALECLYFHSFEPGEDPRISNLAGEMLVADGTLERG
jgi:chromosome segregation ATPase